MVFHHHQLLPRWHQWAHVCHFPNGEQWDGKMLGTEEPDVSWNAVWDCKTKIVNDGWCAEFKIPFAAIRFPDIPIQQWDINFGREIRRHRIIGTWNPVDPNGPGDLVQMGVLKGVEHVQPPKRIFFFPTLRGIIILDRRVIIFLTILDSILN